MLQGLIWSLGCREDEENQVVLVVSTGVVLVVSTGSLADFLSSFDGTMRVYKSAAGEGFIVVFNPKMRDQDCVTVMNLLSADWDVFQRAGRTRLGLQVSHVHR